MHDQHRFEYLLNKFLARTLSAAEKDEFFDLLLSNRFDDVLSARIGDDYRASMEGADLPPHIAQEIIRNILSAEKKAVATLAAPATSSRRPWIWAAAAAAAALIFLSVWLFNNVGSMRATSFASLIPDSIMHHTNTGAKPATILLPDKSQVILHPQATLHYPRQFNGVSREVYLDGSAFFTVTKNPDQPFYVYYNKVVTKVLGTSFEVGTNDQTGDVEVMVQSGKVQVFENSKLVQHSEPAGSVIVMPNQKAIYKAQQGIFESTLVEHPQPVNPNAEARPGTRSPFVFEQTKLSSIFEQLQEVYAISIVVENENIYNCVFSGDISQQDLYGKLRFVCLTISADYEINGTKILIKGKGCNP